MTTGRIVGAGAAVVAALLGLLAACVGDDPLPASDGSSGAFSDAGEASPSKSCNGVMVSTADPDTGCAAATCDPCPRAAGEVASCTNGACASTCASGRADCNPAEPGCETDTTVSAANCGACGHVCGKSTNTSAAECDAGACAFTCTDPFGHCSNDDATGCETNLGTSSDHCGACGHSCLGGACVSGKCQKVLLAGDPTKYVGLKSLYGLAVIGGELLGTNWFQNDSGHLYKVPVDGGPLEWLLRMPLADAGVGGFPDGGSIGAAASPMTVDGAGKVLYGMMRDHDFGAAGTYTGGVWQVGPDGKGNSLVVPEARLDAMATDGTHLYWTGLYDQPPNAGVHRALRDGTQGQRFLADRKIANVFAEGGSVYLSDNTNGKILAATAATIDSPIELASTGGPPGRIQTDPTYVYYFHSATKKFFRVKKLGGSAPEDVTPADGLPASSALFLVDASRIWFVGPQGDFNANNQQKLYAFPKDGKGSALVVTDIGADNVSAMTQDATAVYYTTYGRDDAAAPFSAVYKIAK